MSTHKHFDKICCVVLAVTLLITVLFVNAEKFGIEKASTVMGYESTLFDKSVVHTIDIIMDDWEEFTANCKSEKYYNCTVVIDNDAYKNVAIRGKGNTSLSQVSNDRYSYKIEFDHYDSTNTYYGLDKLCLNNIIQDNTYMKDYITYTMMYDMGVASPLCSYAYVTVNGEDWGLYLAVEGVEEAFLQRNYGKDYGELYKPDSMSMGGGRGNGDKFDMGAFFQIDASDKSTTQNQEDNKVPDTATPPVEDSTDHGNEDESNTETTQNNQTPDIQMPGGQMPEGMTPPDFNGENPFGEEMPEGMIPPDFSGGNPFGNNQSFANMTPTASGMSVTTRETTEPQTEKSENLFSDFDFDNISNKFSFGDMGSSDVKLQYIDDNAESYSNIFDNAKTDITTSDKTRLIESLKKLSNGEDLESTVDVEAVIRYFVIHNFVLNFDSYTGSMIHNYYLYEKDGQMQMIPWDYNLAFGGFMSMGGTTSLVNYPIDSPVSGGSTDDRPMISWIFSNEEYTKLYHKYFNEFISEYFDSGYFSEMIDNVKAMISPYVEKDPTKFCTYDEFITGIDTLKEICLLRAESVKGQLDGTIGSTSDTQKNDTLIDADDIQISDMGSMGMGGNNGIFGGDMQKPQKNSEGTDKNSTATEKPTDSTSSADGNEIENFEFPQMPENFQGMTPPDFNSDESDAEGNSSGNKMQKSESSFTDKGQAQIQSVTVISSSEIFTIALVTIVFAFGIIFALKFKRRK